MINFRRKYGLLLLLSLTTLNVDGQDLQFSQFYAAPTVLNPALLGAEQSIVFGANVRRQDTNLDEPSDLIHAYASVPIFLGGPTQNQLGAVGLSFYNNSSPSSMSISGANSLDFSENAVFLSGAYNIPLKFDQSEMVTFGVQFGFVRSTLTNNGNFSSGIQYTPFEGDGRDESIDSTVPLEEGDIQNSYPVVNAGIMYYFNPKRSYVLFTGSAFSGLSVYNINQPDRTFLNDGSDKKNISFRYHGGMEFFLLPKLRWTPTVMAIYQNKDFQFNGGNYLSYNIARNRGIETRVSEIVFGVWYRLKDAAIVSAAFNRASWTLGFSYDFNVSFLGSEKQNFGGALEVSLSYRIIRNKALRTFSTPLI